MSRSAASAPERQLALLLVGIEANRTRNRTLIEELACTADYPALEAVLRETGLLTLIGRRVVQASAAVPQSFAREVERYAAVAQRQGVSQVLLTTRLIAALTDAGIRVLALKGPLLSERIYGDVESRVSADIDLLVDHADLERAVETLASLNYSSPFGPTAIKHRRPEMHEVLRSPQGLPEIELHWRLHWHGESFGADMLARAVQGPHGYLLAQAADEFAGLLISYARDGFAGLRRLADITTWWDRFGHTLAPGELDALVTRNPTLAVSLATSAMAAKRLGGLPADELLEPALLARASPAAMRLSNWAMRGPYAQACANVSLVDWFLAPAGRRRALLARHVWLPEEVLWLRQRERQTDPLRARRLRALHVARIVLRYAIALWQTRRKSWAPAPPWLEDTTRRSA